MIQRRLLSARAIAPVLAIAILAHTATAQSADTAHNLPELYDLSARNDMQLQAARQSFEATRLKSPLARANLLPEIDLNFSKRRYTKQQITGQAFGVTGGSSDFDDYYADELRLELKQTLFNMEQFIALSQSKSEVEAAELRYRASHQDMIMRLVKAYFNILSARSRLDFASAEKTAYQRQLEQARERFNLGLTPITDTKEAQAAYDLAIANEIEATNELHNYQYALTVIVNIDVSELMALDKNFTAVSPAPNDIDRWVTVALKGNLELLAKQIDMNVADKEIDRNRAGHLPEFNLFLSRSQANTHGGPSPREYDDKQIGVELQLPLFAGGKTHYATAQAAKEYARINYEMKHLQHETRLKTRTAYLNITSSISRIQALERALESAQAAVTSNEEGFRVGTRTSVDVLTVLKDLFQTRYEHTQARHTYIVNTLELKKLVGTLAAEDIFAISKSLTQIP